jgi:hypothetical protein
MGESTGDPTSESTGDPMGDPMGDSTFIDQFYSSYNQKKPFIDFGRFLIYNTCCQRNRKVKQARHIKQKAPLNKSS